MGLHIPGRQGPASRGAGEEGYQESGNPGYNERNMNHPLLKKTLLHTLKWYPLVLILMGLLGWALAQRFDDPLLAWGLALAGAVVGPLLEAGFYYRGQIKADRRQEPAPVDELSYRLSQVDRLRDAGLLNEAAYEQVRQAVIFDLTHRETGPAHEDQKETPCSKPGN